MRKCCVIIDNSITNQTSITATELNDIQGQLR